MKVVKQNLSDVLYIADTWIQADRRRVAERVREACAKLLEIDISMGLEQHQYAALARHIRALDIDKLLGEE